MSFLVFPCPFSAGVCKPFFSIVVWCCKVGSASEEYFWKWRYINLRLRRGLNQVKLFAHSAAKWLTPGSDDDNDQYGAITYWHNYVYLAHAINNIRLRVVRKPMYRSRLLEVYRDD